MFVTFDFAVVQVRYIAAAINEVPSYQPDGNTFAQVNTKVTDALTVRSAYINTKNDLDGARSERRVAIAHLHEDCVAFAAQATSRYRNDEVSLGRIKRLPTQDQTFQETMTRADAIIALWTDLPPVGSPPAAFSYADETATVSLMEFIGKRDATRAKDDAIPTADQAFQKAEGDLHVMQAKLDEFVTEALKVGRSQFAEGTAAREVIDAVPTTLPTQVPGQAVIAVLTSPAPTVIHVEYDAPSGTSFDLFWRVQGNTVWILQAEDVIQRERDLSGAVTGTTYEVMVRGKNSRGTGPDSAPGVVTAS